MAIRIDPISSTPAPLEFLHTKDTVLSIEGLILSAAGCCFCKCDLCLPILVDLADDDPFKNDFSSFIISATTNATVTPTIIKLNQDGTETNIPVDDQTFGDLFDFGVLRSDVWAFKLIWRQLAAVHGYGRFKFNLDVKKFSKKIFNEDSVCFEITPWSCEAQHETVRIEVAQKGSIEDGFDFRGLIDPTSNAEISWLQQIRTYGMLTRTGYTTETESIPDGSRRERQIQTRNFKNWNLKLNWIRGVTSDFIIDEMMLANPIKVSDFNAFNTLEYRDIELKYLSTEDPEKPERDQHEFFNIKLEDYRKAKIKRHG